MLMGEESDYQEDDTKIVIDPKQYYKAKSVWSFIIATPIQLKARELKSYFAIFIKNCMGKQTDQFGQRDNIYLIQDFDNS